MPKLVVIFVLFSCKIFSTELDVELIVADTSYTIGDKILLQYNIEYNNSLRLIPPDFSNISPYLECLGSNFDSTTKVLSVTLISFEAGDFDLPPIPFLFENISNKRLFTCLSPAYNLNIDSIKISSNQIKEAPFEILEEKQWNFWGILGAVVVLTILICGLAIRLNLKINK